LAVVAAEEVIIEDIIKLALLIIKEVVEVVIMVAKEATMIQPHKVHIMIEDRARETIEDLVVKSTKLRADSKALPQTQ